MLECTAPVRERPVVSGFSLPPAEEFERRSNLTKLRRGLTFLGMTVVLPGSAQLTAGNRRVGRIAIRVWAGLWAALLLLGLVALVWRHAAFVLAGSSITLRVLQILLILVGVAWGLLMIDAWRLSRPPELARRHRLGFATLSLVMAFVVSGALFASASVVSTQRDLMTSVFAGGGQRQLHHGRINVLLLGGDAGSDRVGLRPDSMTVASIDADTGRTALFSMPRNLEKVPFPKSSPMQKKFPHSYTCPDNSCMLNSVYTYASHHRDLYPDAKDPGAQATKDAAEGVTGLKINYYALIDLKGFQKLIDAVGGIKLNVNKRVPIGGGSTTIKHHIEPGKNKQLNGYKALWFARSRHADSDYERMARQKCVMNAMLDQLDPMTVLTRFNKIAKASKRIMATDVPSSSIDQLIDLAGKAKKKPISSVAFVPPLIQPNHPDYQRIHASVQSTLAKSGDKKSGDKKKHSGGGAKHKSTSQAKPTSHPTSAHPTHSPKHHQSGSGGQHKKTAKDTHDLKSVCST